MKGNSNPANKDTEGALESVRINGVSQLSGCQSSNEVWMYLKKPPSVLEQKREPKTNSTNISLLNTNACAY